MIEIKVYDNGFEIEGHANAPTCVGISSLARLVGNCIYLEDKNSWGTNDYGYTIYIFDNSNQKAKQLLKAFIDTVKESFENVFSINDVKITYKNEIFKKKE